MPTKNPGSLTPFCLATNDDNSAIYGLAYGFNTSQLDLGEHIILLKASTTATPPVTTPSFTSLAWSVIAMVQRFRVTSGYGYGDGNSGTCSVSSSDPAWVNLTFSSDVAYPWGYYGINYTSPRLFYVSSSLSSLGGENQSTNPTLLLSYQSTVNLTDIIFAQEDGNRKFYYAGTMKIPTTYFGRIITTTSALGRLYAIGYPYANPNATQVVSIPVTKDSIKKFPTAGVKVYSASPTAASACTENQSVTASMVGNNTFYMLCGTPVSLLIQINWQHLLVSY
ncbi:hypothetical protein BGZ83_003718 [Gryganskiella cystojenkinii]|nr:hypothetical protein BGZ83_003718 [Gryganskiella cystojenkinii]